MTDTPTDAPATPDLPDFAAPQFALPANASPFTLDDVERFATLIEEHGDEAARHDPGESLAPVAGWVIETEGEAEWAMRHLADVDTAVEDVQAQAAEWRAPIEEWARNALAPIDEWERTRLAPLARRRMFFDGRLVAYMRRMRTDRRKSIPLVSGRLESRGGTAPKVTVLDEAAVVEWAEEALDAEQFGDVVKVTRKVLLDPFRSLVAIVTLDPDPCPTCKGEGLVQVDPEAAGEACEDCGGSGKAEPVRRVMLGDEVVPGVGIEDPTITYKATPLR